MEPEKSGMPEEAQKKPDMYKVLELVQKAGQILLENGAEISRVEETMQRMAACYGVRSEELFVLSNGIFMTGDDEHHDKVFAKVKFIPIKGTQFSKVIAINQLSREMERGHYTLEEAEKKVDRIDQDPGFSNLLQMLAAGLGSSGFCIIFGGTLMDALPAFLPGFLVYAYLLYVARHFSKITTNLLGGALVTLVCILMYRLGLGEHLSSMIIGSVIPLIPGVAFVNGATDLANGDYISGAVRLLDAILGFLNIAIGVGIVYMIYHAVTGGVL